MSRPVSVHLAGGEGVGWALDTDLAMTRAALELIPESVRLVDRIEDAETVHSVWDSALLKLPREALRGKRVMCHVCTDVFALTQRAESLPLRQMVGLWVAPSQRALSALGAFGLRAHAVPYTVDTDVFRPAAAPSETRRAVRRAWGIPDDAYVICNFMRDSLGSDLLSPKWEKGPEMLVEICRLLVARGFPLHVLLAGPRRHWVRGKLAQAGVPYTFAGRVTDADDNRENNLPASELVKLYRASDLHLTSSRSEGGPRAVLECAATGVAQLSTPVGVAEDILEPCALFTAVDEAVERIDEDRAGGLLRNAALRHLERIEASHTASRAARLFAELYDRVTNVPVYTIAAGASSRPQAPRRRATANLIHRIIRAVRPPRPGSGLHISLWHEFHKPPYGGGNQFMLALQRELRALGVRVSVNRIGSSVDAHICNSTWFDRQAFEAAASRSRIRMIHRIDGPVALVRGTTWEKDEEIQRINEQFAAATVFQSEWCMRQMCGHGLRFRNPLVIGNAVDGGIFHPGESRPLDGRPVRLISSSWSDNPRKGGPFYKWLDEHLPEGRYAYTFVGRVQETFSRIRHVPPQDSAHLAELLRQHDIYITASQNEPCSNALLEALACGLPALYLQDGSHGSLVGQGGLPFQGTGDVLGQLERLARHHEAFRRCIRVPTMREIAERYVDVARALVDGDSGL